MTGSEVGGIWKVPGMA